MGLFGGGTETTTTAIDPQTQAYLDAYRKIALGNADQALPPGVSAAGFATNLGFGSQTGLGGLDAYFNPYESQVVSGVQSDFDRQRALALKTARQEATRAGAYGGSRGTLLQAAMLNDVNRNETGTLANIRSAGYTNAVSQLLAERARQANLGFQGLDYLQGRQQAALQGLTPGLMPGTTTTATKKPSNVLGGIIGLATQAAGTYIGLKNRNKGGDDYEDEGALRNPYSLGLPYAATPWSMPQYYPAAPYRK